MSIEKHCTICGKVFYVAPYRLHSARFCSLSCKATWLGQSSKGKPKPGSRGNKRRVGLRPTNAFPVGHTPWNKGIKGTHFSPATEFKSEERLDRRCPIGTVRLRLCKDKGYRAFVKVADPNIWRLRATVVWESVHGSVPYGHIIHHQDRDTLNDSIDNLACLSRAEHLAEHRREWT